MLSRRNLLLLAAPPRVALVSSMRIGFQGIGPILIGMSERQIRTALSHALDSSEADASPQCYSLNPPPKLGLSFLMQKRRLARIDVQSEQWQTPAGARVGMTPSQIRRIYGARLIVEAHPYVNGNYFILPGPNNRRLLFETDDKYVTNLRAGTQEAVALVQGCA